MSGIVIVPADRGDSIVARNFKNTIDRPVGIKRFGGDMDPEAYALAKAYSRNGAIRIWGTMPGNSAQFAKIELGDGAYFTGGKKIYGGGLVVATWWSEPMARKLWPGPSATEPTWECMFALSDFHEFDLDTEIACRSWLGYNKGFFQNFVRLDPKFAPKFRTHLPLAP